MKENVMKWVFLFAATLSILAVGLICVFLFANGVPAIGEIGVFDFLLGQKWKPSNNMYGIFPMIVGSVYVTAGAIIVGVPLGILCAVFLAWFCPKKLYKIIKPAVELLAGIPSIVYGFFGLVVLVPIMQNLFGGSGKGVLTASGNTLTKVSRRPTARSPFPAAGSITASPKPASPSPARASTNPSTAPAPSTTPSPMR